MRTREPRSTAVARCAKTPLALLLAGALLAGCGDDSTTAADGAGGASPSPEQESSSAQAPAQTQTPAQTPVQTPAQTQTPGPQCGEVWIAGETLPGGYRSCYDGETEVEPESRPCSFGKPLLTHEGRFWSVRGGRIAETGEADLLDDQRYRRVLRLCTA